MVYFCSKSPDLLNPNCESILIRTGVGKYKELIAAYKSQIRNVVNGSGKKLYTHKAFLENDKQSVKLGKITMVGIEELMEERMNYFMTSRAFTEKQPSYIIHEEIADSLNWRLKCQLLNSEMAWIYVQQVENGPWKKITMTNKLEFWQIEFSLNEQPQRYFIRMENQESCTLFPSNAPRHFLKSENVRVDSNFE